MRWLYPAVSGLFLILWAVFGSWAGPLGLPLPALGDFFNPARGYWQNTQEQLRRPGSRLELSVDHPLAGGEVHFDDRGVPHIFGESLEQACFLQGYVNAFDRMWQMDISTRSTEGALAQVLGPSVRERDETQIRRGFREAARRTTATMRSDFPADYRMLEAYAAGYNSYLATLAPKDYPVEYKLLGHVPQPWSPYRTALLMKGMSAGLSGAYTDAAATLTRDTLGERRFNALFPERFPGADPVVPDAAARRAPATSAAVSELSLFPDFGLLPTSQLSGATPAPKPPPYPAYVPFPPDPDNGSNNWAVSAGRSTTRYPLLANDPHLSLTYPSVWYEAQIHFPGCNARGVGLVGAPGLMMGFNDYVAWGETNVGHDVTDWYRIEWTNDNRTAYRLDGRETAAELITDTLYIRGENYELVTTPWTVFGPVPYLEGAYADMAMRWRAHDVPGKEVRPHTMVQTFLNLMQARNYSDYREALRGYVDPAQNFLFAASDGDIAIRPNGFFPLRRREQGRFLQRGDSSKNNWQGVIPFDERPVHYNPARGFVSSANQVTTGPRYPYYYLGRFGEYRGRYINRVLGRQSSMSQRSMKELQLDDYALLAEEVAPLLIARIDRQHLNGEGRTLLRVLSEWDYHYTGESRAPAFFEDWYRELYRLTFDELPERGNYIRPETWKWTQLLATDPNHEIFDIGTTTNFRETAATLTQRVFDELVEEYAGDLPPKWFERRNATIEHLARIPGFGSPLIRTGGARRTPRVVDDGFGASWRMVIELGPSARGWGALPGGASGNPGSEYYDNGFEEWAAGRYHELTRWPDRAAAAAASTSSWTFTKK